MAAAGCGSSGPGSAAPTTSVSGATGSPASSGSSGSSGCGRGASSGSTTLHLALGGANRVVIVHIPSGYKGSSPVAFSANYIPPYAIGLYVPEPPPTVSDVYPPTGYVSPTLQQQLSTSATGTGTLTYDFTLTCKPLAGQTCIDSSVTSGTISNPYWTPSAADLDWDTPYTWSVKVTATSGGVSTPVTISGVGIEAEVPQPAVTSNIGSASPTAYDPLSGNYTTSATDAAVQAAGPPLEIERTYNSLNPSASGAFGTGWSSVIDTALQNDGSTVLISQSDGQQMRFGENGDGTGGSDHPDLPAEFSKVPFERGTVGMARTSNPNSANSQFFIMFAPNPSLDGQYTIWGQVVSGMEFVDKIKRGEPVSKPDTIVKARMAADAE